jgi:hypothetical protein
MLPFRKRRLAILHALVVFPSGNIFGIVNLVGLINEYTDINITYTNMSHLFIYNVLIYFFICGSLNNAVGNSGQVTQHGMLGKP